MVEIKWDAESAEKGGYEHFMLKEIHEQPKAVQDTVGAYVKDGKIDFSSAGITEEFLRGLERIYIVACGSAYHVGMAGKYVLEELADIPVEVDLASEFRYRALKLVCQRERYLLYRPWDRLCHQHGRQPEDEGDQLYPFRGLCSRGTEARDDQPDRGRDACGRGRYLEGSV